MKQGLSFELFKVISPTLNKSFHNVFKFKEQTWSVVSRKGCVQLSQQGGQNLMVGMVYGIWGKAIQGIWDPLNNNLAY